MNEHTNTHDDPNAHGPLTAEETRTLDGMWDEALDDALVGDARDRFDALMARSDAHRRRWSMETQWLGSLGEVEPALTGDQQFAAAVLERWEHAVGGDGVADESDQTWAAHSGAADDVIGRVGFGALRAAAIAAAVAVMAFGVWMLNRDANTNTTGTNDPTLVKGDGPNGKTGDGKTGDGKTGDGKTGDGKTPRLAVGDGQPNPVTTLIGDFSKRYGEGPKLLEKSIASTKQALRLEGGLDGVFSFISELPVPDPAKVIDTVTQ